jgi:hypothetical protein
MNVREALGLLRHRPRDRSNAMPNRDDGGAARGIEKPAAIGSEYIAAFAANGLRIRLSKISGKESVAHAHVLVFTSSAILADIPAMPIPAAGHFHFRSRMSTVALGIFMLKDSSVSTRMRETARLRNHFLFAGMMYHGATEVLQREIACSYALT